MRHARRCSWSGLPAVATALLLIGCAVDEEPPPGAASPGRPAPADATSTSAAPGTASDRRPDATPSAVPTSPTPAPRGAITLRMVPHAGQALPLAEVTVAGTSYAFLVDPATTRTLVTRDAAARMRLRPAGERASVDGVVVDLVRIDDWRLGPVDLPPATVGRADLDLGPLVAGRVGADVLSRFGRLTIDYDRGTARLG